MVLCNVKVDKCLQAQPDYLFEYVYIEIKRLEISTSWTGSGSYETGCM